MLTAAAIKEIKSLQNKNTRKETGLFVAEGDKICREILNSEINIKGVYALSEWIEIHKNELKGITNKFVISEKELSRISGLKTPNKALIVGKLPEKTINDIDLSNTITLALENIQDPGNLGTIIRTADWFGIKNIICSKDTVELSNPKVIQSSMGSILRTYVVYTNLESFLSSLDQSITTYGAFLNGENIKNITFNKGCIIFFGNESKGISENLSKLIKIKTTIPSYNNCESDPGAESLNVAIAVASYLSKIKLT